MGDCAIIGFGKNKKKNKKRAKNLDRFLIVIGHKYSKEGAYLKIVKLVTSAPVNCAIMLSNIKDPASSTNPPIA